MDTLDLLSDFCRDCGVGRVVIPAFFQNVRKRHGNALVVISSAQDAVFGTRSGSFA